MTVVRRSSTTEPGLVLNDPFPLHVYGERPSSPVAVDLAVRERLATLQTETFISYALEGSAVSIWVADDRGMRFHVANAPASEVVAACKELRNMCQNPQSEQYALDRLCHWLYHVLLQPVAVLLEAQREIHIHFAANFPTIPFALLRSPSGDYFGDTYAFRIAKDFPWQRVRTSLPAFDANSKLLLVDAIPRRDCDCYLMATANLFPHNDMLCGRAATLDQFTRLAPAAEVIHMRCPAVQPQRGPALRLAGKATHDFRDASNRDCLYPQEAAPGWLRVCRLAILDVEWERDSRTSTEASATIGLATDAHTTIAHGFHTAGAENALAPMWQTPEETRAEFFTALYSALRLGLRVQESIRRASQRVRKQRAWRHPHHWAAFQCSAMHNICG